MINDLIEQLIDMALYTRATLEGLIIVLVKLMFWTGITVICLIGLLFIVKLVILALRKLGVKKIMGHKLKEVK